MIKKFYVLLCIMLVGCLSIAGCGGDSDGDDTVSGVVATGGPMAGGNVSLKDSSSPPRERTATVASDGVYSIDVSGLRAPFLLKAVDQGNTTTLYSFSSDDGTANITPLTYIIVSSANDGEDMASLYANPTSADLEAVRDAMPTALADFRTTLSPALTMYNLGTVDPIRDKFTADHTGMDAFLDRLAVDISSGTITIRNKATNAVMFTGPASDIRSGTLIAGNIPTPSSSTAPTVSTTSLPAAVQNVAYSQTLAATGGSGNYSWAVTSGNLPAGLTLSPSGTISGTPTTAGTATFTVRVTDTSTLLIGTAPLSIAVSTAAAPTIGTTSLPNGTVNTSYSSTLTATGGSGNYNWAVISGNLPAGLTLSPSGTISGTPTTAGTATFTVRVTDTTTSLTGTAPLSIAVSTAATPPVIGTTSLPNGTTNTSYSSTLTATGGTGSYSWSVVSGTLPPGLNLAATTGVISGTPTAAGTYTFTVRATNSTNTLSATRQMTITIAASTPARTPVASLGSAWTFTSSAGTFGVLTFAAATATQENQFFLGMRDSNNALAVQHGTFSYNTTTGALTLNVSDAVNTNTSNRIGLAASGSKTLLTDGTRVYYAVNGVDTYTLTKVTPQTGTIIGSWMADAMFVTFYDATHYVQLAPRSDTTGGTSRPAGAEFGTYTFSSGTLTTSVTHDSNGMQGFSGQNGTGVSIPNVTINTAANPPTITLPPPPGGTNSLTLTQVP